MLAPLQCLLVGLQAVVQRMQQFGHRLITDGVTFVLEFLRQSAHTLACPA